MNIAIIHCESHGFDEAFVEFHARLRARHAAFGAAMAAPAELPVPALVTLMAARTRRGDMVGGIRFLPLRPRQG